MIENLCANFLKKEMPNYGRHDTRSDYALIERSIRAQLRKPNVNEYAYHYLYVYGGDEMPHGWIYNNRIYATANGRNFKISQFTESGVLSLDDAYYPNTTEVRSKYYTRPYQFGRYGVIIGSRSQKHFYIFDLELHVGTRYPDLPVVNGSPLIIDDVIYVFGGFNDTIPLLNRTIIYSRALDDTTSPWTETEIPRSEKTSINHDFFLLDGLYYGFPAMGTHSDTSFDYHSSYGYRPFSGYIVFDPENMTVTDVSIPDLSVENNIIGAATSYNGEIFTYRFNYYSIDVDITDNSFVRNSGKYAIADGHTQAVFHTPRIAISCVNSSVCVNVVVD